MRYISILRGINVGGNRKIRMNDLKILYEKLGFSKVDTYIQSGNVIFETETQVSNADLELKIQQAITDFFCFDVPVIVRTADEWAGSIANNPFLKEKDANIEKLHLTLLKEEPTDELLQKIQELEFLPDRFGIKGRDVFVSCENGYGRTKITNDFFEKKLKIAATTRNWNTVMKLHELTLSNV